MFEQYFGHRLRELRLAQGLTKEKFCEGDEVLSVPAIDTYRNREVST